MTDKQNETKILDNINHARIVRYKYRLSPTFIMLHESEISIFLIFIYNLSI